MKKLFAIFMLLALCLNIAACTSAGAGETTAAPSTAPSEPEVLSVGYAREDITPDGPVPLGGYGNTHLRTTDHVLDPLYLTCIAFRSGEDTILLYSSDTINSNETLTAPARLRVAKRTGISGDRIFFCATHTHSAPDAGSATPTIEEFLQKYQKAAIAAAEAAIADLAPATLSATKTQVPNMNFIRHYLMNDGTYFGSNFGSTASGYKDHAAPNDPEMRLIKIDRGEGKDAILMMNWQAHPCFTGGVEKKDISADYIGVTRAAIERETGMKFAFFQGAAGNHNGFSLLPGEQTLKSNDNNGYGEQLARAAISALDTLQPVEGSGIKSTKVVYEAAVNHDDEDKQEEAKQVNDLYKSTNSRDEGNKLARKLGLSSVYHASAILARPSRPQKDTMDISAISIAGIGFVAAPYEMFAASGTYIKENSPFDMTFICSCTNGAHGYLPTAVAYDYGCYESFTSYFAKGTTEAVAEKYVEMLNGLK